MSTEVFVSYSSQDYERVMPLVDRLRAAGVAVWVDEGSIDAATLWSESIVEAIAECRVLIMMVSSHSTDSHNVVKEVMIASESKKTILPIYLEPADIPAKLKYQLTGIQHLEWFDGGNDEVFETLKDGLAKRGVTIDGKTPTNQALGQAPQKLTRQPHRPPGHTSQSSSAIKNIALVTLAILCFLQFIFDEPSRGNGIQKSTEKEPYFLPVGVPDGEKFYFDNSSQFQQSIAISPDGKWFAYISGAKPDGNHSLWLHSVKDDTRIKLTTAKKAVWGLSNPFFSHDSRWLAVFHNGKLKRFSTDTHELNVICDESVTFGGVWSDDGTIYFAPYEGTQLQAIKINSSSEPETIISIPELDEVGKEHNIESFCRIDSLPDGKGILFSNYHAITKADNGSIIHLNPKTKKMTPLIKNGFAPRYSKTGHIVYLRDNTLKAREFDIQSLSVGSDEVTLISGIRANPFWGNSQFSISHEGTLVYIPGTNIAKGQFAWVDRTGEIERLEQFKAATYTRFDLSSDGERIAVSIAGNRPDIEMLDIKKGSSTKLTTKGINWWPVWSPDDSKIVFTRSTNKDRTHDIIQISSTGASPEQVIYSDESSMGPDDWSSDGKKIAVLSFPMKTGYLDMDTTPVEFKELTSSQGSSIFGINFSPNGKWISFSSSIAGGYNCYIAPIDKPNEAYLISNIYQGEEPIWSPDGDEIFHRAPQGMYRVPLTFDEKGGVEIGKAELLFSTPWIDNPGIGHAIHPSGEKFLMVVHEEEEVSDHFNIVLNFDVLIEQKFAELKNNGQP
ncbi:MAG: TIR domain-containing protein [Verrucomicrobia bacterium]|nr:TIR domain-containing protein [Verrucomicrobiota bacterium]